MSELEQLASVLNSRRLARDVLEEKNGGATVTTRTWWMPAEAADMAICQTTGRVYSDPVAGCTFGLSL